MSLPLSLLICLSVVQLSMGEEPVEEIIKPKRVPLLGGWADSNPESRDNQEAAQYAVTMFNTNSKSKKMFKLVSITAAKFQVTNRLNFEVKAILGKTRCLKSENHILNNCNLEKKQLDCVFMVSFDVRKEKYELRSQTCKNLRLQKLV
ncbi:L-cystatin [Channa argus]|uniref:L-cystatin n=1 Tax=Channa argus TaxID=215402 RepID=UPI002945E1B6|nr:hypothetical protein Q8A73_019925 [Channa argus]